MKGARIRVNQAVKFPSPILTHPTNTPFPLGNATPLWAQFALDLSSTQGSEIGGELCLDEAFLGHLCLRDFRKTEKVSDAKSTETGPANLQKIPFRQVVLRYALTLPTGSHVEKERMVSIGFTHMIYSLIIKEWPDY